MVSTRRALIMPAWATATGCMTSSAQGVSLNQEKAISMGLSLYWTSSTPAAAVKGGI